MSNGSNKGAGRAARGRTGVSARTVGGRAGSGGFDFQARVIAFTAVHVLAERALEWLDDVRDVPIIIDVETGRAGDDLRIELAGTMVVIEAQVKRGLRGPSKLRDALEGFITDLPAAPDERGVLVVDARTDGAIAHDLRADLRRMRQGRSDGVGPMARNVVAHLDERGCPELARRLDVVSLAVEDRSAGNQQLAIEILTQVLGDRESAERAWDRLIVEALQLCKHPGRLTRESLVGLLERAGFTVQTNGATGISSQSMLQELLANTRSLLASQTAALASDTPTGDRPAADAQWHAQVDAARDLVTHSRPVAALELFDQIAARLNGSITTDLPAPVGPDLLRRRIEANRAAALVRLGRFDEARDASDRALRHGRDAAVLAIAARAHLLADQPGEAARLARSAVEFEALSIPAWSVLVELGEVSLDSPAGEAGAVPEALREDPALRTSAAVRALNAGDPDSAVDHLRHAIETGGPEAECLLLLTQALLERRGSPMPLPGHGAELLGEVDRLTTQALDGITSSEYTVILEQLLLTRATTRRMQHRAMEALPDAERAFRLHPVGSPERWRPAHVYASLLLDLNQPERAAAVLDELGVSALQPPQAGADGGGQAVPSIPTHLQVLHGRLKTALGRIDEVQPALEAALAAVWPGWSMPAPRSEDSTPGDTLAENGHYAGAGIDRNAWIETAYVVAECAIEAGLLDFAEDVLARVPSGQGGWLRDLYAARLAQERGEHESSNAAFARAVEGAGQDTQPDTVRRVRFEYGNALARQGAFVEAVAQFEAADAWGFGDVTRPAYVAALIEAGQIDTARAHLDELERDGALPPWALSAAAAIAEARDDLAGAVGYLERLHEIHADSTTTVLRLTQAYGRLGRHSDAVPLLRELAGQPTLSPRERMFVAGQLFQYGEHDEALRQAFRAVRAEGDDAELASAFIGLCVRHEQRGAAFAPTRVAADTHVTLIPVRRGDPIRWTVLREGPADARRNEFLVGDSRVAILLGRKMGDIVTLRRGQPTEASYRVAEVKSAVVHAFQDIITHFSERFPESLALHQFTVDAELSADALLPIIALLHRQAEASERALEFYDQHGLPIGTIAHGLGRPVEQVYDLLASRGKALYTEFGDQASQARALAAAADTSPLVITRSALRTAEHLARAEVPILATVVGLGRRLIAPRSLLEELEHEREDIEPRLGGSLMTMAAGPAGLAVHEMSAEAVAASHASVVKLIGWVRDHVDIVPRPARALRPTRRNWRQKLGDSAADALELTFSERATLYADDLGLRRLPSPYAQPRACSTWAIVAELERRGMLGAERSRAALMRLAELGHTFLPVNAELLHGALRDSRYEFTPSVVALYDRLAGTDLLIESVATVFAELMRRLAVDPLGWAALSAVAQTCIERITRGRRVNPTLKVLGAALEPRLRLLPDAADVVESCMQRFQEAKRRGGSLW